MSSASGATTSPAVLATPHPNTTPRPGSARRGAHRVDRPTAPLRNNISDLSLQAGKVRPRREDHARSLQRRRRRLHDDAALARRLAIEKLEACAMLPQVLP